MIEMLHQHWGVRVFEILYRSYKRYFRLFSENCFECNNFGASLKLISVTFRKLFPSRDFIAMEP